MSIVEALLQPPCLTGPDVRTFLYAHFVQYAKAVVMCEAGIDDALSYAHYPSARR